MRRFRYLLIVAAFLAGCATAAAPDWSGLENLPQRYAQFDLLLGWEIGAADGKTVVEGVARNVRYYRMRDLEIWVYLLNERGKVAAQGMTFIIPSDLGLDQSAPFRVELPAAVQPGDRLRFTYKYEGSDGGNGLERGIDWMQSFETVVPER